MCVSYDFFFFQAEDGIRDLTVTGVQTCALPILAQLNELREQKAPWTPVAADKPKPKDLVQVTIATREGDALKDPQPYRSEEHTSELQSQSNLVCRLLLEKKKNKQEHTHYIHPHS